MIWVAPWLVLAAAAEPASAPPRKPPTEQADPHTAEMQLARYSDCVVHDRPFRETALQYLRLPAESSKATALAKKLIRPDCFHKAIPDSLGPTASERSDRLGKMSAASFDVYTLEMRPAAYRNALYPALYRYSFGKTGPGAITDKPPLSVSAEWDEMPNPLPEGWRVRRAIGDCVARGHPQAAHRFVVSKPWSDAETAEIPEISTGLAECLPVGQTVSLGREDIRGIVGEALYKLAMVEAPK